MEKRLYTIFSLIIALTFWGMGMNLHAQTHTNFNLDQLTVYSYSGNTKSTTPNFVNKKLPSGYNFQIRTKALNDFSAFNIPLIWTSSQGLYIFPQKYFTLYRFHLNGLRCENYSLRGPPSMFA